MDIISMKQDFYKRFDNSDNYVHQVSCGLLCTLLGFPNIKGTLSLTYPLSVGVTGLCRSSGSDKLELENTATDELYTQRIRPNSIFTSKVTGGQILLDNEIPPYFDSTAEVRCCALKCVLALNSLSQYDKTAAAASCCGTDNIKPYLALLNASKGYCLKSERLKTELLPLPLSGYKIILAQFDKKTSRKDDYKEIEKQIDRMKKYLPQMTAISDLTAEEIKYVKPYIKDNVVYNRLIMIINDNGRINRVTPHLMGCRTEELFDMMNSSAHDFLHLWGLEKQEAMLLNTVFELEGVKAVRFWNKGIIAVVQEERVDYVVSSVEQNFKKTGEYDIKFCISK